MTAGEEQLEALVADRLVVDFLHAHLGDRELAGLLGQRAIPPDAVDRPVAGRDEKPGRRVGRLAVPGPALGGDGERLLNSLLGAVKVAEEADQAGQYPGPVLAEDALERRQLSTPPGAGP